MVITIDGPSGAGKSTVSRRLARALGFACLDTGALYRAVALGAVWAGWEQEEDPALVEARLTRLQIDTRCRGGSFQVLLDGREVESFIRNERIGGIASRLSALAPVRAFLLELQRRAADQADLVAEGRDMGTVVFPRAEMKFFLTASDQERARRRYRELKQTRPQITLEQVAREMAIRDQRDAGRDLSPLAPAPDAIVIDSDHLDPDQVVRRMLAEVGSRRS